MKNEIVIPTRTGKVTIKHPIVYELRAKKFAFNEIGLFERHAKTARFSFKERKWYNFEEIPDTETVLELHNTLALVCALDGKKVRLTIEVLE